MCLYGTALTATYAVVCTGSFLFLSVSVDGCTTHSGREISVGR